MKWNEINLFEFAPAGRPKTAAMKSHSIFFSFFIKEEEKNDWLFDFICRRGSSSATNNNSTSLLNQFQSISSIIDELMDWWRELIVVLLLLRGCRSSINQPINSPMKLNYLISWSWWFVELTAQPNHCFVVLLSANQTRNGAPMAAANQIKINLPIRKRRLNLICVADGPAHSSNIFII